MPGLVVYGEAHRAGDVTAYNALRYRQIIANVLPIVKRLTESLGTIAVRQRPEVERR